MTKITYLYPYSGELVVKCKACDALIYFYAHPSGRMIPVVFATKEPHWTDCIAVNKFRKLKDQQEKLF